MPEAIFSRDGESPAGGATVRRLTFRNTAVAMKPKPHALACGCYHIKGFLKFYIPFALLVLKTITGTSTYHCFYCRSGTPCPDMVGVAFQTKIEARGPRATENKLYFGSKRAGSISALMTTLLTCIL